MLGLRDYTMSDFLTKQTRIVFEIANPQNSSRFARTNIMRSVPLLMRTSGAIHQQGTFAQTTPEHQTEKKHLHNQIKNQVAKTATDTLDNTSDGNTTKQHYFDVPFLLGRRKVKNHERQLEDQREREKQAEEWQKSIDEAEDFLENFVRERWECNFTNGHIKIHCNLSMGEVRELGRLDQVEGSRECRKLISAPVIHDAIGHALWVELSKQVLSRQKDDRSNPSQSLTAKPQNTITNNGKQKRANSIAWTTTEEISSRRARSLTRRATDGDAVLNKKRSHSANDSSISKRNRRKSEVPLVRADQVMCTTCGSRAMGSYQSAEYTGSAIEDGEKVEEGSITKRNSISRRLSHKMSKKLTSIGGGMASGYGGSRMIA